MSKKKPKSGKHYSWAHGSPPIEQDFVEQHVKLHDITYEQAYNEVYRCMRTTQEMLLTNSRFMLPGIGIIGLAENPIKGLVIASTTMWFTPGLLTVIARAPGWENAPLNPYLTDDNIHRINELVATINMEDSPTMTARQFYLASDLGGESEFMSDEKLEYYTQAANDHWLSYREKVNRAKYMLKKREERKGNDKIPTSDS